MSQRNPQVSLILPTKNGAAYLKEVLKAVFAQEGPFTLEVLAIDSGSRDGTMGILKEFPLRLYTIAAASFNHGGTRNLGARLAHPKSRYLAFLSQDATPLWGWLAGLVESMEAQPSLAGAFSRQVPRPGCAPALARQMAQVWEQCGTPRPVLKRITDWCHYWANRPTYAYFSNTASCIRRSLWTRFPFAAVSFAEDAEWADRVLRAGQSLLYQPRSAVLHSHTYSLVEHLRQNFDHARAMKSLFDLPAYRASHPLHTLARVGGEWRADAKYIGSQPLPWPRRLLALLHSPLWHLAGLAGSWAGCRSLDWPFWAIRALSHQYRLLEV